MRWGLCVFRLRFRLRHCFASQILLFRIVCDGEVVRFERNPCGEVNSLIDNGRSHKSHTSESIRQPHQSLKYKPVRV